ncbi:MAG: hypothetical protein ACI81W_000136 [Saprospiraceae bacterium]|jgi:hypothetical protein
MANLNKIYKMNEDPKNVLKRIIENIHAPFSTFIRAQTTTS